MLKRMMESRFVRRTIFVLQDLYDTDFLGICAQMSFYLLMSFFPLLAFINGFVGGFILGFEEYIYEILKSFLPDLSLQYILDSYTTLEQDINGTNYLFLILVTFIFATLAARAIMTGLNTTYGEIETRSQGRVWLLSIIFTILFAVALIIIFAAYLFSTGIGEFIFRFFKISGNDYNLWSILTIIFSFLVSAFLFDMIYIFAPAHKIGFTEGLPGAIAAPWVLMWPFVFCWFLNVSSKYTVLYEALEVSSHC